jgi:hypothetical protein
VKLVDTLGLDSNAERLRGSSPLSVNNKYSFNKAIFIF